MTEDIWPNDHTDDCPVCGDIYVYRVGAHRNQTHHSEDAFTVGKVCVQSDRAVYLHSADHDDRPSFEGQDVFKG